MLRYHVEFTGQLNKEEGNNQRVKSYIITIYYKNKKISVNYFTGMAVDKPSIKGVIKSLLIDALHCNYSIDEFMSEFGYDDKKSAKLLLNACKQSKAKLYKLFNQDEINQLENTLQDY